MCYYIHFAACYFFAANNPIAAERQLGKTNPLCYHELIQFFFQESPMSYDLCLHVDANDPAVLAFAFVNARNYMNGLPGKEFELVLVANGPAVKLFVPAQAELQKTAEELMARGLKLRLCKNALDANKMTAADLWPGCEVVPAGLVEIVELQNKGFAYIRP